MPRFKHLFVLGICFLLILSCRKKAKLHADHLMTIDDSAQVKSMVSEDMKDRLDYAIQNKGRIEDSIDISFIEPVFAFYESNHFEPVWVDSFRFKPRADSLLYFLRNGLEAGLFPGDYHLDRIDSIRFLLKDSLKSKNAGLWTTAELLQTNAFMHVARDLKQGRLQADSSSWHHDEKRIRDFFVPMMRFMMSAQSVSAVLDSLQPKHVGYRALKSLLKGYLDSMDTREYTYVSFPFNKQSAKDSLRFISQLKKRLVEAHIKDDFPGIPDSTALKLMITEYQKKKHITVDGKYGEELVTTLNNTDIEKFKRLAISLDKYKSLPEKMPENHIWVNLPEYGLWVWQKDSLLLYSHIICGKPKTPTPTLNASISELVVLPTWTVPESIIAKEMLPGLKRDPGYLARKGLYLLDTKGNRVDPATVNWSKYKKGIPYKIQQGSGDDNALGVIKFNFANPYAIYLHDTNQRYLFKKSKRALSHGCVRVQEWQALATQILRYDSLMRKWPDTLPLRPDSIQTWVAANKRKWISIKNRYPLFIRYFSCVSENGRIRFLEDVYKLDKELRDRYFVTSAVTPFLKPRS